MLGLGMRVRAGRRRLLRPLCRHKISIFDQGPEGIPDTDGLDLQILGSSAKSPTPTASCPAVGVRVGSHHWIFDCGEGTQRQLLLSRMMKLKMLRGICITHMHGDHVLGLPGMVLNAMTLHSGARLPSIYGPEGLYNFLSVVLKLCEVRMSQNHQSGLTVHELLDCYEGEAPNMLPYHRRQPEFKLPNVHYKGIPRDPDGFWTIESNEQYELRAGRIEHGVPTFGYVLSERARRGSLDVYKVRSMGLEQGPIYRELAEGRDVTMPNGTVIRSAEVLSPSVPGRKVTILGDTCNPYAIAPLADDSDVLVHEATLESAQERVAVARGHSTPTMAATFAKYINAKHLVLNHMSNRYRRMGPDLDSPFDEKVDEEGMEVQLVEEAEAVLGQGRVTAARDLLMLQLPRRAGGKAKVSGQKKKELLLQQRQEKKEQQQAEEEVAVASTAAAAVEQPCPPPSSPAAADPCSPREEKEEEPSTVSRLLSLLRRSSSNRDSTSTSSSVASAAGEGAAGRGSATGRSPRQSARAQAWP